MNLLAGVGWVLVSYLCGALPLSFWLGKLVLKVDIRTIGDGNPGGTNVWKAGGPGWGLLAIILDGMKGLVPVALAYYQGGASGWWLLPICLAPIIGHAYTPFLNFKGGKSLATTFGVWTALTVYTVPLIFGAALGLGVWLLKREVRAILLAVLVVLVYLLVVVRDPVFVSIWVGNALLLLWRYRGAKNKPPSGTPA
jgi:acyl phosphate:glycerol-3-phosphate acyltransferase